ncbi:MAG TPA: hypothetical protein PLD88_01560, partial [Candidatus Berkiella sp.]|nr:hypothetical protein [Candidatus Berkiella sp.]
FYQKNSPIILNRHPEEYFIVHHDIRDTIKKINKKLKINPNEYVVPNPHPNDKIEVKKDHDNKNIDPPKAHGLPVVQPVAKPVQHAFAKDKVANKPKGDNKNKDKKHKADAGHKA